MNGRRARRFAALLAVVMVAVSGERVSSAGGHPGVVAVAASDRTELPASVLAVRAPDGWRQWWTADQAPPRWGGIHSSIARALAMHPASDGVEWGELTLAGSGEAWRTRVVVVRIDPRRVRLVLDTASAGIHPAWTVSRAPARAVFAVNAGQFGRTYPWGLVLLDGHTHLPAGAGPLVSTIAVDSSGGVRWGSDALSTGGARWAFQSYPTLLRDAEVPMPLRARGSGVDVDHRDARLAVGRSSDGRLVFALTRFDALGSGFGAVPFGLTVPEMAAVMGALGTRDAVLLDGGISAQMMLREPRRTTREWAGMRPVPLALVALPVP